MSLIWRAFWLIGPLIGPLAWALLMLVLWTSQTQPILILVPALLATGTWCFFVLPWWGYGFTVRNIMATLYSIESLLLLARSITSPSQLLAGLGSLLLLLGFGYMGLQILHGIFTTPKLGINLAFPLSPGRFAVAQGGNTLFLNHHVRAKSQRHALDIVALGRFGMRADRLSPTHNSDYTIWGACVTAPCAGTVVAVQEQFEDAGEQSLGGISALGNHVILQTQDATLVVLAHLQRDSVAVKLGELVSVGSTLGRVGNSGRSTEPHLHLHAQRDGVGVPMRFDGRLLVRNSIVEMNRPGA